MYLSPVVTPIPIVDTTPTGINLMQAVITAAFAVVSGFVLYGIKTYIDEKWLRQHRDYKKMKADIAYVLIMYADIYMNPSKQPNGFTDKASIELRSCAARLGSFIEEWSKSYRGVPKTETLKKASEVLMGLSNRVCSTHDDIFKTIEQNEKDRKEIKELLGIKK